MKYIIAVMVVLAGYQFWWKERPFKFREVSFIDANGRQLSLKPWGKPSLLVFWISNCGYSDRALKILKMAWDKYSAEDMDVIGFYLNPISNEELKALPQVKDYNFTFVSAQQRMDLISTLAQDFKPRAGTDIFLIDQFGRAHRFDVSSSTESSNNLFAKLDKLILKNIPNIRMQSNANSVRDISSLPSTAVGK